MSIVFIIIIIIIIVFIMSLQPNQRRRQDLVRGGRWAEHSHNFLSHIK